MTRAYKQGEYCVLLAKYNSDEATFIFSDSFFFSTARIDQICLTYAFYFDEMAQYAIIPLLPSRLSSENWFVYNFRRRNERYIHFTKTTH